MSKKQSKLEKYLAEKGISPSTPHSEIEELKKEYWRDYHRNKYQERKKREHRFNIRLTPEEYSRLRRVSKGHGRKMGEFIKEAAIAYVDQGYVVRNKKGIADLTSQVRSIGRTINQAVQKLHRRTAFFQKSGNQSPNEEIQKLKSDYQLLVSEVEGLRKVLEGFMASPPLRVGEVLREQLEGNPERIQEMKKWIDLLEKSDS